MRFKTITPRIIVVSAIITGSFFAFYSSALAQTGATHLEQERASLQQELDGLEKQIAEYGNELGKRQEEISTLRGQIDIINAQIAKLDAEIKKTRTEISATRLNIQETRVAIDQTGTDIEKKKAVLAELLRNMYVLSNESLVEQLLRYRSLTEALSQARYATAVQEKVNLALAETRELRQVLESNETKLEQNENQLESKNRELSVRQNAQANQRSYKNTLLKETRQEEKRYQQLLSQAEQERADFLGRLAQVEEQIKISQNFLAYFKAGEVPPPGTKIFIWPLDNPRVTQSYGFTAFARRGAYGGQGHNGVDMTVSLAAPIRAAAGGTVAAKGDRACVDYVNRSCNGFWGNWVAIEHPGGLVTLYSHLTRPSHKAAGQAVEAGEIIGYEGATGNITGPHLHFTVYTEFFTYKDPKTGETRFSYNFAKTLNPLDYL